MNWKIHTITFPNVKKYIILTTIVNIELKNATKGGKPKKLFIIVEPTASTNTKITPNVIMSTPGKNNTNVYIIKNQPIKISVAAFTLPPPIKLGIVSLNMKKIAAYNNPNFHDIKMPKNKGNLKSTGTLLYLS